MYLKTIPISVRRKTKRMHIEIYILYKKSKLKTCGAYKKPNNCGTEAI